MTVGADLYYRGRALSPRVLAVGPGLQDLDYRGGQLVGDRGVRGVGCDDRAQAAAPAEVGEAADGAAGLDLVGRADFALEGDADGGQAGGPHLLGGDLDAGAAQERVGGG